jgi:hypothetical protein
MTRIEREALILAENRCIGTYGIDHLFALHRLKDSGLVRNVRSARSAWYEPTEEGRAILAQIHSGRSAPGKAPGGP